MERIKSNVSDIVEHLKDDIDNVEVIDTNGVVMKFNSDVTDLTIQWICECIRNSPSDNINDISLKRYEIQHDDAHGPLTFIVTTSLSRYLQAAERHQLLKKATTGKWKPFTSNNCMDFDNYEENNEEFFTCAEKQYLLKEILDHVVNVDESAKCVVGCENIKLYKGKPILPACIAEGIVQIFPLHDYDDLKFLRKKWYATFSIESEWKLPIEKIKGYFGEHIAQYFYFLSFYTKCLILPAVVGLCHYLFCTDDKKADNVWFAILNLLWANIFLELWKRKRCYMLFNWGRLTSLKETSTLLEKPRAVYRGVQQYSPITGQPEIYYPSWKRQAKFFVTYPATVLSIIFAIITTQLYLKLEGKVVDSLSGYSGIFITILTSIPTVLYTALIFKVNGYFGRIAVSLNNWENHRVQTSYDNHLIIKLTLFYFINCYMSSFYIAFYLQDMTLLRQHLATLLISKQLIQQVTESLIPYALFKMSNIQVQKDGRKIHVKATKDPKNQVIREGNLLTYDAAFGDYLEMVLQFGYVFMFSAVYPLAAFWALLNNITEMKTDAFKLCRLHQRPFAEPGSVIDAWEGVFDFMAILAVITNCGIIAFSPTMKNWLSMDLQPVTYISIFVTLEHILLLLRFAIQKLIPNVPGQIIKEFAKKEYQANKAAESKKLD